jgi:hypothetical protein
MADADWQRVPDELFQEDLRGEIVVKFVTVEAESELAEELLLNPRRQLVANFEGVVTEDWSVSLERVNAELGIRIGPRKLVAIWIAVAPLRRVHGVVYRAPSEAAQ